MANAGTDYRVVAEAAGINGKYGSTPSSIRDIMKILWSPMRRRGPNTQESMRSRNMFRRRVLFYLAISLFLGGCASTKLVNEWQVEGKSFGPYRNVLVIGIGEEAGSRRTFEDVFSSKLRTAGTQASPSYSLLPSTGAADEQALLKSVREANADAVLMTRLVRMDNKTEYTPPQMRMMPGPGFYGYYNAGWAYYEPGRVNNYTIAVVETNLWDAASQELVWSGTTETFQPGELRKEVEGYSDLMIEALQKRKLLQHQ
jgi:hypothetical protein